LSQLKSEKEAYIKEIEKKSNFELQFILETGDDVIKNIYEELKKIADSEVAFQRKIEDEEVKDNKKEKKEETQKPLVNLKENVKKD